MADANRAVPTGPRELHEQARERSLRFLDFLQASFSARFPPVRVLRAYGDIAIGDQDVPEVAEVTLSPGGDVWLSCELRELPPTPKLPPELSPWVQGPISALSPPRPTHPDPTARALLELASSLPNIDGQAADIGTLDEERLRAHGIRGGRGRRSG
ncbi:MAG: hypothetical protein M1435_02815 [Actinobacteria bacterium]|nr:hypothetical protein [Actinomycetota bacterium]